MKIHQTSEITEIHIKKLPVVFTAQQAAKLAISRLQLKRLVDSGTLIRMENGIFRRSSKNWDVSFDDFACACIRFGKGAYIGGLSALAYHQLLNFSPRILWVVAPSNKRSTKHRLIRMTDSIQQDGIETIAGIVKIAGIERALVDAFRFAGKVTLQHAFYASRQAFSDQKTSPEQMLSLARKLGVSDCILKHWEALQFD